MLKTVIGPVAGTRSRATSGALNKDKKVQKGEESGKQVSPLPKQKLVSAYLIPQRKYCSDNEAVVRKSKNTSGLKSRSNSGNLYHSELIMSSKDSHFEESEFKQSVVNTKETMGTSQASDDTVFCRAESLYSTSTVATIVTHTSTNTTTSLRTIVSPSVYNNGNHLLQMTQLAYPNRLTDPIERSRGVGTIDASIDASAAMIQNFQAIKDMPEIRQNQHLYMNNNMDNMNNFRASNFRFTAPIPIEIAGSQQHHFALTTSPNNRNSGRNSNQDPLFDMLRLMNDKLTVIQEDVKSLKDDKVEMNAQITGMQYDLEDHEDQIGTQSQELKACQDQVELLTNYIARYDEKFEVLTRKVTAMEMKEMKPEIIVFGLNEIENKTCMDTFKDFCQTKLDLQNIPEISYAYWKGSAKGIKPMVVHFKHVSAKKEIYAKTPNLKDKTNEKGNSYQIEDHLPEEIAEIQRRQKQIVRLNKKVPQAHRATTVYKKGKLFINNAPYEPKVPSTKAMDVLAFSTDVEALKSIQEITVANGGTESEQGSTFHAFACPVQNTEQIRKYYIHFKRRFPNATHISMGYKFSALNKALAEDCLDDGEFGFGRKILHLIAQSNLENIMVVVIRFYGGKHIGGKRFEILSRLVQNACSALQQNEYTTSKLQLRQMQENLGTVK